MSHADVDFGNFLRPFSGVFIPKIRPHGWFSGYLSGVSFNDCRDEPEEILDDGSVFSVQMFHVVTQAEEFIDSFLVPFIEFVLSHKSVSPEGGFSGSFFPIFPIQGWACVIPAGVKTFQIATTTTAFPFTFKLQVGVLIVKGMDLEAISVGFNDCIYFNLKL